MTSSSYPRSWPSSEEIAAAKALAQLSDAEWLRVKRDEDRRRADQRIIRDLSRELRDRKMEPSR